ncbi:hypothetical protein ACGC1H_006038 [Rhizoctonia solani]
MNELLEASKLLRASLTRYMDACSAATKTYDPSDRQRVESHHLLDCITRELQAVSGYEEDLRAIKSTLAQSRNSAFTISPINALPCEVLNHIFGLLSRSHGCLTPTRFDDNPNISRSDDGDSLDYGIQFLTIPEIVSRVCSHWRKVALSTHELWTHVDIITFDRWCTKLLSRSKLFASRTLSAPLDLHVSTPRHNSVVQSPSTSPSELKLSSALIAPKIGSFRLDDSSNNRDEFSHLINYFLRHITPGALTRLILLDHSPMIMGRIDVIDPNGPEHEVHSWISKSPPPLWMSMKVLDEILLPVKVLWLRNRFFPWDSRAYSGLVDLRLLSHDMSWGPLIGISELVGILSSCPELRIFHCELDVDTHIYNIQPTVRIVLKDLEALKLHGMLPDHSASLLSHIYPGTKPLSLSIRVGGQNILENLSPQLSDFFRRTNIERLFLTAYTTVQVSVGRLFPSLPAGLRTLGFNSVRLAQESSELLRSDQPRWTKIDTLILDRSTSDITTLHRLATAYSIRALVLNPDDVHFEGNKPMDEELKQTIPIIRKISKEYGVDGNGWISG